jgi:hypothetical protein
VTSSHPLPRALLNCVRLSRRAAHMASACSARVIAKWKLLFAGDDHAVSFFSGAQAGIDTGSRAGTPEKSGTIPSASVG